MPPTMNVAGIGNDESPPCPFDSDSLMAVLLSGLLHRALRVTLNDVHSVLTDIERFQQHSGPLVTRANPMVPLLALEVAEETLRLRMAALASLTYAESVRAEDIPEWAQAAVRARFQQLVGSLLDGIGDNAPPEAGDQDANRP